MKSFKLFLSEDCRPEAHVEKCTVDIDSEAVRESINLQLDRITSRAFLTPYAAFEAVSAYLATYHIFLPKTVLEGDHGVETWPIRQFGQIVGMKDNGEVATEPASEYNVYFEYQTNDSGWFKVFCEVVAPDELEDLLDDVEDQINEEMMTEAKMTSDEKRVMINTIRQAMRFGKNLKPEKTKVLTPKQSKNKLDKAETSATHEYHQIAVKMPKVPKAPEATFEAQWNKSLQQNPRGHYDARNLHKFMQIAKAELQANSADPFRPSSAFKDYTKRLRDIHDAYATWAGMSDYDTIMNTIKDGHAPVTSSVLQLAARHAKKADAIDGTNERIKKINDLSAKTFGTTKEKKLFGLIKKEKPKLAFS